MCSIFSSNMMFMMENVQFVVILMVQMVNNSFLLELNMYTVSNVVIVPVTSE